MCYIYNLSRKILQTYLPESIYPLVPWFSLGTESTLKYLLHAVTVISEWPKREEILATKYYNRLK